MPTRYVLSNWVALFERPFLACVIGRVAPRYPSARVIDVFDEIAAICVHVESVCDAALIQSPTLKLAKNVVPLPLTAVLPVVKLVAVAPSMLPESVIKSTRAIPEARIAPPLETP